MEPAPANCPTPSAHRRLEEAHRLWHRCLDDYQDPDEFRTDLNGCIQALRNVTFVLQSEQDRIEDFDDWYKPWRERMRADEIMRWLNDARVQIVHRGDLETESRATIRLLATYDDATAEFESGVTTSPRLEVEIEPASSLGNALDKVASLDIPKRLMAQASISIERRWVDSNLPDTELLTALAHAFGLLSALVADAHDRAGADHGVGISHAGVVSEVPSWPAHGGRPPCMVTSRAARTARFSLRDGRVDVGGRSVHVQPDPAAMALSEKRYKARPVRLHTYPTSVLDRLPRFVESARSILRSGDEHGWFIWFYRGANPVHHRALAARDAADKRVLSQELAELVYLNDIDGVMEVGECWVGEPLLDEEGAPIPAAEQPDRREAVTIHVATAAGVEKSVVIPFRRRRFGRPVIEDPVYDVALVNNFIAPIKAAWRRQRETP